MAEQLNPIVFIAYLFVGMFCFSIAPAAGADDDTSQGNAETAPSTPDAKATGQTQTTATPSTGETKPDPLAELPSYGEALIRMVVALVSILIALLILAKLLPRWLNRSFSQKSKGNIAVVDSIQLEPRRRVYLLRVGGRQVLIGSSEQGLHTLVGEMPNGEDQATSSAEEEANSTIIQPGQLPGHQPSSLATPFESVMKSKDASRVNLPENA